MSKTQVEVITSVERRRRWSSGEKERLVAASLEPGAAVSALAREAGLHPSQLYKWRRQLCARHDAAPGFAPVQVISEPAAPGLAVSRTSSISPPTGAPIGVIEIEFASGTRLRITGAAAAATVSAAVGALTAKERRS
jgi:transposase